MDRTISRTPSKGGSMDRSMSFTSLLLCLIVLLAFTPHLFIYTYSAVVYVVVLWALVVAFVFSKKINLMRNRTTWFLLLWLLSLVILTYNYLFIYSSPSVLLDVAVLLAGYVLMVFYSNNQKDYAIAIAMMKYVAAFFALGVLFQSFIPPFYRGIVNLFPKNYSEMIKTMRVLSAQSGIYGFTINTGFTASYILAGLFSISAQGLIRKKLSKLQVVCLLVFILAFLLTGKRAPFVFSILAFLICYMIPLSGSKKRRRERMIFFIGCIFISLYLLLQDFLVEIPGIGRIIIGINGVLAGEDMSHGRMKLYSWALQLFRENPWFGIGWGRYRTTVVGNATLRKTLEVHNVYLQILCETGIFGFMFFVSTFVFGWFLTKESYCQCLQINYESFEKWKIALCFSMMYQTYFLLYCLTGNALYDQFYQIMYMFSCAIMMGYRHYCAMLINSINRQQRKEMLLQRASRM